MHRVEKNHLTYYQSDHLADIRHGIFTRHGGISPAPWASLNVGGTVGDAVANVQHNHRLMYDELNINPDGACTTWQVHAADVVMAQGPVHNRKWLARADGVITHQPDVALVMRFADCVPLLFYDPAKRAIGLSHAGWRGTVQGMAKHTVLAMKAAYGSQPADIRVVIGPSISVENFQVGEEVVAAILDYFGTVDGLMRRNTQDGSAYVDLWEANRRDLLAVGVRDQHIEIASICTYQNTEDFFSHRAEHGKTGRFGVVLQL